MSMKQLQQVFQYLQLNGLMTNDKVLKEVQKHPQPVWQLLIRLCANLKNKNIQSAYSQLIFLLPQHQKHERSAKWLRQYMDIRQLAMKLGTNYTIMDYVKPQRDRTINLMTKIIQISKGVQQIKQVFDQSITNDQLLSKQQIKFNQTAQQTRKALIQIQQRKRLQKPACDIKNKSIQQKNIQISDKRQQKLNIMAKQKLLRDQLNRLQKTAQDDKYEIESKLIKIQQLKKQLALNAPQVKKQKKAIEEQHQKLQKEIFSYLQTTKLRQQKLQHQIQQCKKFKNPMINLINNIIEKFNSLEHNSKGLNNVKNQADNFKQRKNLQIQKQRQSIQDIRKFQMEIYNMESKLNNAQIYKYKMENKLKEWVTNVSSIKQAKKQAHQKLALIQKKSNDLKQKIQDIKQKLQKDMTQIQNQAAKWDQTINQNVTKIYDPIINMKLNTDKQFQV